MSISSVCSHAVALPNNYGIKTEASDYDLIFRPRDNTSEAIGFTSRFISNKESAIALENPLKGDKTSTKNGERLFEVQCTPCHGAYNNRTRSESAIANFLSNSPDLSKPKTAGKPDGYFFKFIYFGGQAMPACGYKLSIAEHWDIVNYVREFQKTKDN